MTQTSSLKNEIFQVIEAGLEAGVPMMESAIWLAALDRPLPVDLHLPLSRMREILTDATRATGAVETARGRIEAVLTVLRDEHGFKGNRDHYDDLENADMIAVLDTRTGLPVALSIIAIDALRAVGLEAEGISFPAHFLLRAQSGTEAFLIDPFNDFQILETHEVRDLVKKVVSPDMELQPAFFVGISDRDVLFRLLNNIKVRAVKAAELDLAFSVLERLRLLSPVDLSLGYEQAIVHARLGRLSQAIECVEHSLTMRDEATPDDLVSALHQLLAQLRSEFDKQQA